MKPIDSSDGQPGSRRTGFRERALAAVLVGALAAVHQAIAQGTVRTSDGLSLSLDASGSISSLQSNGSEYASPSLLSGFLFREVPAAPVNVAPNGSFESGSTVPDSWEWTNDSSGTWSWDSTTHHGGARSMRITVPGTAARRSPSLTSSGFAVASGGFYTVACQMKTQGLTYPLTLFFVVGYQDGSVDQFPVSGPTGTSDWTPVGSRFSVGADAVSASLMALVYDGSGTAWLDDVQVSEVFGGAEPAAFGGAVAAGSAGLTQTAGRNGLGLSARYTSVGPAIRVDATISDQTGRDRAVEVSFRLPVGLQGFQWQHDPATSVPIAEFQRYENVTLSFHGQSRSLYPLAAVGNGTAAFALAMPMAPQVARFNAQLGVGFQSVWDFGFSPAASKTPSQAIFSFWIYAPDPSGGFRAALDRYYLLNPDPFGSPVTPQGAWALAGTGLSLAAVPNFQDFGWGFVEGTADVDFANGAGLQDFHYIESNAWFREFPGYTTQPPYDVVVSALENDASSGTGYTVDLCPVSEMARAVINSSPYDPAGRYQISANPYFWYGGRLQVYPISGDPDIPAPSMWSVVTKYSVDEELAYLNDSGNSLAGLFLDDMTSIFSGVENYRRELWAYSDHPLTFSYITGQVTLPDGFSMSEFCTSLRVYAHQRGLSLMGSVDPPSYGWFAPCFDVLGGEVSGAETLDRAYVRRALGQGRPWTNLFVPASGTIPAAADVLAYLRQALLLGYFPGFNGAYWKNPSAYERDRALFRQFIPLIRIVAQAGWQPITGASASSSSILAERFDDARGAVFYVTAQNTAASATSFQLSLDAPTLGIGDGAVQVQELVHNVPRPAARAGSKVNVSDTLGPGETALYRITAPRSLTPLRRNARSLPPRS